MCSSDLRQPPRSSFPSYCSRNCPAANGAWWCSLAPRITSCGFSHLLIGRGRSELLIAGQLVSEWHVKHSCHTKTQLRGYIPLLPARSAPPAAEEQLGQLGEEGGMGQQPGVAHVLSQLVSKVDSIMATVDTLGKEQERQGKVQERQGKEQERQGRTIGRVAEAVVRAVAVLEGSPAYRPSVVYSEGAWPCKGLGQEHRGGQPVQQCMPAVAACLAPILGVAVKEAFVHEQC